MDAPGPGQPTAEMDALDLLTEDCWKEILQRVTSAKDLKSCSEACLLFEEILQKKKNQFMFGLVLPHLFGPYGLVGGLLNGNELLKCRLVCKRWSKSIDHEYESKFRMRFYFFDDGEPIQQFLQMYANHHGNPFLGRSVDVDYSGRFLLGENRDEGQVEDENPEVAERMARHEEEKIFYAQQLRNLLARFGSQIWSVGLREDRDDTHLAFCKSIQMVLSHMSNLRSLELGREGMAIHRNELGEMTELPTYIAANPLPDLPRLEHLETSDVHVAMIRLILDKYAPQLKSLVVGHPSGYFPDGGLRLCNLKELTLFRWDASTPLDCFRQLQSPLRQLSLRVIHNSNNVRVWPIDELFRNIQHLPIQHLKLYVSPHDLFLGESGPISAEDRPYHGSISSLHLNFPEGCTSFNFLLYCPKLTSIHMTLRPVLRPPAGHPNGVAELLDVNEMLPGWQQEVQGEFDLHQSNIWEQIPSLGSFQLEHYKREDSDWKRKISNYVRTGYERRKLE